MPAPWIQPPPTTYDPRGFAVGILSTREIQRRGLRLRQFRWRYGPEFRANPFHDHRVLDGRFMTSEGELDGFWVGDHAGCRCGISAVWVVEGTRTVVTAP